MTIQTRVRLIALWSGTLLSLTSDAFDMNAEQYTEYMAHQHCANQQYWEMPEQLERTLSALDQQYGITENDLDTLDEIAMKFSEDPNNQAALEAQVRILCP